MTTYQSAAPANSMILGEHSVVYGHPAIACALDQWIIINWLPRNDQQIVIQSELGSTQFHLQSLKAQTNDALRFVLQTLKRFPKSLPQGFTIHIKSDIDSTMGLGSSAAVLAAMLSGLNTITQAGLTAQQLWDIGHEVIQIIQGRGSATDLAASLQGGIVFFQPKQTDKPAQFESVTLSWPFHLFYSGYKTPTAKVLAWVAETWQDSPQALSELYQQMGNATQNGYQALKNQDFLGFFNLCRDYQSFMQTLKVSDQTLNFLVKQLETIEGIHCAKISGSGLGDCVMALGELNWNDQQRQILSDFPHIELPITPKGAYCESLK
jgi:mevalonate kinase